MPCSATGETADRLYCEAIERLSRTHYRPDLGRAYLLYGEWLRREDRRTEARTQCMPPTTCFRDGAEAFAERARRELRPPANASEAQRRDATTRPRRRPFARLARDGRTNPEIAAQLFLSARTVQYHLRKVFAKLGITSRRELRQALSAVPHGPRT